MQRIYSKPLSRNKVERAVNITMADMATSVALAIRVLTLASDNGAARPHHAPCQECDFMAPWRWRPFKMPAARQVGLANLIVLPPLKPPRLGGKESGATASTDMGQQK